MIIYFNNSGREFQNHRCETIAFAERQDRFDMKSQNVAQRETCGTVDLNISTNRTAKIGEEAGSQLPGLPKKLESASVGNNVRIEQDRDINASRVHALRCA